MSTVDKFTLAQADIVPFQASHEPTPIDIFNFDTKDIDKFTHKEKSILVSDVEPSSSKNIMIPSISKTVNGIHAKAMQNTIFNKLYDEGQVLCNVPFDVRNEMFDQLNSKAKSNQETLECAGKR